MAPALLMAVTLVVVYTKGLRGLGAIAIDGIVGLNIFFFAFISGASTTPTRSLDLFCYLESQQTHGSIGPPHLLAHLQLQSYLEKKSIGELFVFVIVTC